MTCTIRVRATPKAHRIREGYCVRDQVVLASTIVGNHQAPLPHLLLKHQASLSPHQCLNRRNPLGPQLSLNRQTAGNPHLRYKPRPPTFLTLPTVACVATFFAIAFGRQQLENVTRSPHWRGQQASATRAGPAHLRSAN